MQIKEMRSTTPTGAAVFGHNLRDIFRKKQETGKTAGENAAHLKQAGLTGGSWRQAQRVANDDVREGGDMFVAKFAVRVDDADIFNHAVIVDDAFRSATKDRSYALREILLADRQPRQTLPASAVKNANSGHCEGNSTL